MRSFRKTFLADDYRLIDSYLLPGFSFLLQTATIARTGGDLPLPSLFTTLGKEQPKVLGLAFLGLFFLNGWFFDGILTARAKIEGRPPRWLRLCRFCFSGIPLLGIYSFPVWEWMTRKGIWKDRDKATTSPPAAIFHAASHVVPVLTILVWGLNLLLLYSAVIWSSTASFRSIPMAVQWGLQGLGFLCVQIDIISLRRHRSLSATTHLLLYLFSILWLFPWPACVVAGLAHLFLVFARSEPKLRMRDLFRGRFNLGDRLSNATGRDWWKVSGWRAWRLPAWLSSSLEQGFGDDGRYIGRLYRIRVLLTIFDAIALVLAIRLLSKAWPAAGRMLVLLGAGILPFSAFLVLLGMLVLGADFTIRHLGRTLIHDPAHHLSLKYFVLTQMALLSGVWIGHLLMTGESWRLGIFLVWIGWITSLFVCFFALPMHPRRERFQGVNDKPMPWIILSLSVAGSGQLMLSGDPRLAAFLMTLLLWAGLASPFLGLTLGFFLGRRVWSQATSLSKQGLAICSSILPFGGLALPLWAFSRSSSPPQIASPPPDDEESQSMKILQRAGNPTRESRDYCFSHLVEHFATAGNLSSLFRLAEETSFLADQIAHVKGFHKTQEDLESWIIPAATQAGRWAELIRFFSMAIHLRGVSEDLSDPTVLRVLTAQNEFQIAQDAVQGVADPLNRAVAKAVVAGALDPGSETRQRLVQTLSYDLASLALPSDDSEQERQFWALIIISQELGMAAVEAVTAVLEARREWSDAIWGSLAQCQANLTGRLDPIFWNLLSHVKDFDFLSSYLPDELAARDFSSLDEVLDHVDQIAEGDLPLGWLCRAALLGVIAARSSEEAWGQWQRWNASHPAPWSIEFVERATPFLRSLDDRQIMDLAAAIPDDETRLAYWVSVLSADRDSQALVSALRTAEDLPPSRLRAHWTLRLFSTPEIFGEKHVQAYLKGLAQSFRSTGYDADIPDLCHFLTLIARHLPEDLPQEMEKALWAPAVGSEILFALVDESGGEELLAHLFENLDRYFAPFFPAEAEGFRAWSELLVKITSRLCALRGDLLFLDRALRLNPEEADILCVAAVKALIAAKRMDLAETVCSSISSKRQRYLTRFEIYQALPGTRAQASLHELFTALSDLEPVHQEILGLKAIASARGLSSPQAPAIIRSIKSPQEQFTVLFRLAWRGFGGRREPREVGHSLELLSQAVGLLTSDTQLAAWVPELMELVAHGRRHLVPEIREALQSLLSLRTVDLTVRRDLCESLLARALPWLCAQSAKRFCPETAKVSELMADVLSELLSNPEEQEKRSLIPVLFAALDRLPSGVMEHFLRDTTPNELLSLCLQDQDELVKAWDREAEKQEPDPLVIESILYLLSYRAPALVPFALGLLPSGPFRDRVSGNLLRHGWLPADFAPDEVLSLIGDPEIRLRTEIWLGLSSASGSEEEEAWLGSLAALMSQSPLDPTDPRNEPCLRKLWTLDPKKSRPILAHAALQALIHQGRWHGMSAFCFWLHAHLAPDVGCNPGEVLLLCDQAQGAIQRSLRLAPAPASTNA